MAERVIVVTGGGRGIGRATCLAFARRGDCILAAARTSSELQETQRQVERLGGRCEISLCNVCHLDEVQSMAQDALEAFGRIDVLINAAGVAPLATFDDLHPDVFATILSVNVSGTYYTCREVWPVMVKQGGGVIVNVSSMASVDPLPGLGAYGAAKAWVNAWTRALAHEGRPRGIGVFCVAPGAVETRMLRDAFPDYPRDDALDPADVAEFIHALTEPTFIHAGGQTFFYYKK